jgi:hypothetical protein
MTLQTCHHGRLVDGTTPWDVSKGEAACDDCDVEEWARVRVLTIVGTLILVLLIFVPLVLLLTGVLWG